MTAEIQTQSIKTMEKAGGAILLKARGLQIVTADDYQTAAGYRVAAKTHIAVVKDAFRESKQKADATKKAILDLEKKLLAPAEQVVGIVDEKMLEWSTTQERIQVEAQRKAEEAAQKEAERARAKEIKQAEKSGDIARAEALEEAPVVAAPVVVESRIPTGTGATVRKTWKGECTDLKALVAAIAAGTLPINLVEPNQSALDAYAKATGGQVSMPGFRAYEHASMAGTGR